MEGQRTRCWMLYCYFGSFILSWIALSTYHKWLNKFFGKPDTDAFWFNWIAHGLGIGLAVLPFVAVGISVWMILCRAVVLGILMMLWSDSQKNTVAELGRGALIIATIPLLFLVGIK